MNKFAAFGLAFVLASVFGIITDWTSKDLFYYARAHFDGMPLPPITEWVFNNIGRWQNGGFVYIFLVPWEVLILVSLLGATSANREARDVSILYGLWCFAAFETSLFLFLMTTSLLPFIPNYMTMVSDRPRAAYFPHFLLVAMGVGIIGAALMRARRRRRNADDKRNI